MYKKKRLKKVRSIRFLVSTRVCVCGTLGCRRTAGRNQFSPPTVQVPGTELHIQASWQVPLLLGHSASLKLYVKGT